jgi:hypothetical protein
MGSVVKRKVTVPVGRSRRTNGVLRGGVELPSRDPVF